MAENKDEPHRRDFLVVAGDAFVAVGAASLIWPFVDQMNPDAGALALATVEVDLDSLKEGQAITVMWRGTPIFIRHRTAKEIEEAKATKISALVDEKARNENANIPADAPATDQNRTIKGHENWMVLIGVCTHLGCIPKSVLDTKGDFGGWFCPCHGSHYDTSGRIRKGPAPQNLEVPPYQFVSDKKIRIG